MTMISARPSIPRLRASTAARSWAVTPGRSGRWPCPACSSEERRRGGRARGRADAPSRARVARRATAREVGHLPVPARRAEPDGPVRPQAGAGEVPRQAVPRRKLEIHFNKQAGNLLASPFRFRPHGQSGMVLSELLPHLSGIVDDLTLVRSMATDSVDHETALRLIHTGKILAGPADLGLVGRLRPGDGEPEPAGLRGPVRPRRPAGRRHPQLVERLAAGDLPGDAVPLGRCAGAQPGDADGASRPRPAPASSASSTS